MKSLLMIMLLFVSLIQTVSLSMLACPIPVQETRLNSLREAAIKVGIGDPGEKIMMATILASKQTGLSESFLLSLMYSESSFNPKAVSSKQYQGLMQIPQKVHYEDANTLIGARIFLEKLEITNGDYRKAIIIYKGWEVTHPEGKRQADKVLVLARKLKEKDNGR